jgi:RNA polymerase sigma-70 factor (ECF subfamily)
MNPEQFQSVFRDFLDPVSKFLARRVEPEAVEDLAADVFGVAWNKRNQIPTGYELPWLYKTARYVIANHRRKNQTGAKLLMALRTPISAPSAETIALAEYGLADAWSGLTGKQREILSLSAFEELSSKEIAKVLETTENSVNIRLSRARKKFAELLKEN